MATPHNIIPPSTACSSKKKKKTDLKGNQIIHPQKRIAKPAKPDRKLNGIDPNLTGLLIRKEMQAMGYGR